MPPKFNNNPSIDIRKLKRKNFSENLIYSDFMLTRIKNVFFFLGRRLIIYFGIVLSLYLLESYTPGMYNFLQNQWNRYILHCNYDDYEIMKNGIIYSTSIFFIPPLLLFSMVDITGWPKFITKYKIQPGKNEPLDSMKAFKGIVFIIFNSVLTVPAIILFYEIMKLRGYDFSPVIPKLHWVLCEIFICMVSYEFTYYYAHRALHSRLLYKPIHKLHHDWQAPIALASIYSHPIEHVFGSMLTIVSGIIILGSHPFTIIVWSIMNAYYAIFDHCGYHLPYMLSPERHDYHHLKFTECYASYGIMDYLHGTDKRFRHSKNADRDKWMWSFVPPREAFPDS